MNDSIATPDATTDATTDATPDATPDATTDATTDADGQQPSTKAEHEFHAYATHRIPWYVPLMWVGFVVFAIYYVNTYLVPELPAKFVVSP